METSLETVFQNELIKDEKVYWSGKPDPSVVFGLVDFFLIPFSLLWCGFAVFWELSVLGMTSLTRSSGHAPVFFALFGAPFVLMGFYMVIGRFFYKAWKKGRTYYAVTNKRVIQIEETNGRQVQAQFLNQIPAINKSVRSSGVGSLTFGNTGFYGNFYGNSGMLFWGVTYGQGVVSFYDVPDADRVYALVNQLRGQAG